MRKQFKIISISTILMMGILTGTVGATGNSAMCNSLTTVIGAQERVLYGETEDNLTINSGEMVYNREEQKYVITLVVSTTGIEDGTQLDVTEIAYGKHGVDLTSEFEFSVSGNSVNSNSATIVVEVKGDVSDVKRLRIVVTHTREDLTTESEYKEFKINLDPTVTVGTPILDATNLPEDIVQIIKLPVITEDVPDDAILKVKLVKDGIDIEETKYTVEGNTVSSGMANIIINAGLEIGKGAYTIVVTYEYVELETPIQASHQADFEIINIPMKKIEITQSVITLEKDEKIAIEYIVIPNEYTNEDLKFTSDDETIAIIEEGGIVTAVGRGETTLTISSKDDTIKATCKVSVVQPEIEITKITITPETIKQAEDAIIELVISTNDLENAKSLDVSIKKHEQDVTNWFILTGNLIQSNEVNLVIKPDITKVVSGEYKIFVSYDGKAIKDENYEKQTISFNVVGNVSITGITVDREEVRMTAGTTKQIMATLVPENVDNKKLIWVSNDEDIASVDSNGLITANANGSTIITVYADENTEIYKTINVTVQEILTTEEYTVEHENRIIKYIPENTNLSSFMFNIRIVPDVYTIVNKKGTALTDEDLVGTETKLTLDGQEYKLIIIGDTNGDGKITVTDVSKLKLQIVELEILGDCAKIAVDMNRDGNITPTDLSRMKLYLVGLE